LDKGPGWLRLRLRLSLDRVRARNAWLRAGDDGYQGRDPVKAIFRRGKCTPCVLDDNFRPRI
jgi:hypothetical protein